MTKFTIPTPAEVDYDNNEELERYLEDIKDKIIKKNFQFKKYDDIEKFISRINSKIKEFGWKINEEVTGQREDCHMYYEIKPLKK